MSNGTSRIALANIQLKRESPVSQVAEEKKLDKPAKLPKFPLKASGKASK